MRVMVRLNRYYENDTYSPAFRTRAGRWQATARALDPAKGPSQVEVVFFEPEKFTDVKDSYMGTDKGRDSTLELIKEYLVTRGVRGLLPGQKLFPTYVGQRRIT
jgi:hypothetical protein